MTNALLPLAGGAVSAWYGLTGANPTPSPATVDTVNWTAWQELVASAPFDADAMFFLIDMWTGEFEQIEYEFALGPAGSEWPVFSSWRWCDGSASGFFYGQQQSHVIPLRVPKGARVSWRIRADRIGAQLGTAVGFIKGGTGMPRAPSRIVQLTGQYGVISSTTNALSAWTQVTASCPANLVGIIFGIDPYGISTGAHRGYAELGVGASGSERVIAKTFASQVYGTTGPWASLNSLRNEVWPISVRAGARLAVRGRGSAASRPWRVCLHGLVA